MGFDIMQREGKASYGISSLSREGTRQCWIFLCTEGFTLTDGQTDKTGAPEDIGTLTGKIRAPRGTPRTGERQGLSGGVVRRLGFPSLPRSSPDAPGLSLGPGRCPRV